MRKIWLAAGATALVTTAALAQVAAPAPSAASPAPAPAGRISTLVRDYVAQDRTPGIVVAYARGDRAPTIAAAGRIASDPGAAAADADSLWRVYSMTKPITGMAAMILIEEGKLKLDQPVGDFIPGFKSMRVLIEPDKSLASRPATRPVTVRNLLTHTAGLGYTIITTGPLLKEYERLGINPAAVNLAMEKEARTARPATLKEFADRVATLPLIAEPGTKWSYSIGLDVLGRVIEVAAGMPFDTFVRTRIFDPLKMKSSFFTVPASETGRLATNYLWAGDNRMPIDPGRGSVFAEPPSFPYGGAGLVMSARDYDRFLHMLLNQGTLDGVRIMKPETVRLAMSNLLPPGVFFGGAPAGTGGGDAPKRGFGAGGSVYLESEPGGPGKGTYGWGGAAGTIAWVDPVNKVRATAMVNYFPGEKWPLRPEVTAAVYADLTR
ncbi:serine hydrolase domain-containing protein [Sphingomonas sp.]|uniref:serine hydrolase domain-containing protein n=1 Tax=Sphingomonas sp. TaxID=28214 RepID=UPI001EB79CBC|nr:serine hydrolase domain-containing protein [Sphingomonas sp.]MBX3593682.1 beta-lactamase family protein [Sphingomonas sp.]